MVSGGRFPAPGTEGFATAYDGFVARIKANPLPKGNSVEFMPGSLGWAIEKFLASPLYDKRAETTKRNYRRILDQLRQSKWGRGFLADLKSRHVRAIRNEIATRSTTGADMAMSLISALWEFATEKLGIELDVDPTHGVPRVHEVEREHEPWPARLIVRFMREARPSLRWAVKLALYTGQRRSDLVKMKWSEFDGNYIKVRQQKTGALLAIACHKKLRAELESMPRVAETILVGERGSPLTGSSLSVMVRKQLRGMGVDGYAIHGLRKNAAVALANAGCTPFEIAAITGHRTLGMVAHYAKRRDQRLQGRSAMDKWERSGKLQNRTG